VIRDRPAHQISYEPDVVSRDMQEPAVWEDEGKIMPTEHKEKRQDLPVDVFGRHYSALHMKPESRFDRKLFIDRNQIPASQPVWRTCWLNISPDTAK
jgi:hypothetical protein